VTSAFIAIVHSEFQPDSNEETNALLRVVIHQIDNTTSGGQVPTVPQWTGPSHMAIRVQAILLWALQTSVDEPVRLSAVEYLETMVPHGSDPIQTAIGWFCIPTTSVQVTNGRVTIVQSISSGNPLGGTVKMMHVDHRFAGSSFRLRCGQHGVHQTSTFNASGLDWQEIF